MRTNNKTKTSKQIELNQMLFDAFEPKEEKQLSNEEAEFFKEVETQTLRTIEKNVFEQMRKDLPKTTSVKDLTDTQVRELIINFQLNKRKKEKDGLCILNKEEREKIGKLKDSINCNLCNVEMVNVHDTHNPFPLCKEDDYKSRCCSNCNSTKVIPARLSRMFSGKF